MTITVREQAIRAVLNRLETIEGFPGLKVERNRDTAVQVFPSIILIEGSMTPNNDNSAFTAYDMNLNIEGYVKGEGEEGNALLGAVQSAILQDNTLGGIAFDVKPNDYSIEVDRSSGTAPLIAFSVSVVVTFFTAVNDPFTAA